MTNPTSDRTTTKVRREALKTLYLDRVKIERLESDRAGLVQAARANGATWQQIGNALGTSRQAAQARYRAVQLPF